MADDGAASSTLVNTNMKGSAMPIMLQQFWCVIGIAIVKGEMC